MLQSKSILTFLKNAKGRHGLHSPFVFQLVDHGLTAKPSKNFLKERKKWLKAMHQNKETFEITDLGVGSKKMSNRRSVSQLAKTASSNGIYGNLLWKLCHFYQPKKILELGTSIGVGTFTMSKACPDALITTIEGCLNTLSKAQRNFDDLKLSNIITLQCSFDEFFAIQNNKTIYDLIYLDGNHQGNATLAYIEQLQRNSNDDTLFIMDDIRWSKDMWKAWNTVVKDERFHVTIDLGRMGLFWKRPHQTKEHFIQRPFVFKTKLF